MPITRALIALVLFLGFPLHATALDPSAAVKVMPLLKTTASWNGRPLAYPTGQAEVTGLLVEIAPGAETGWHEHSVPSFGLLLEGDLEVTLNDGQVKRLHTGDALAEVVDTPHNGRNVGSGPAKIIGYCWRIDRTSAGETSPRIPIIFTTRMYGYCHVASSQPHRVGS